MLQKMILEYEHILLKEKFIFDFYKNDEKEEIKIGFRLIFQDNNQTITDEQVDEIMNSIISKTHKLRGVTIPGISL